MTSTINSVEFLSYIFHITFVAIIIIQLSHYILLRSLPGKIQYLYRTSLTFYKSYQLLQVVAWAVFIVRFDNNYKISASVFVSLFLASLYLFWAAVANKHFPKFIKAILAWGALHITVTGLLIYFVLAGNEPAKFQQSFSMMSPLVPLAGIVVTEFRRKQQWRRGEYVLVVSLFITIASVFICTWARWYYDEVIFFYLWLIFSSIMHATLPFTGYISSVITQKFDSVTTEATTDFLTQSRNRRFLDSYAARYPDRIRNASFFVLDIDNFKTINDTYGHDVGDEVLRHLSQISTSIIRSPDFLVRLGGEEFFVLCHNALEQDAATVAERFRAKLANTPFQFAEKNLQLTASFGVSAFDHKLSLEQNIALADSALYLAKANGKNKVCTAKQIAS
ncbi:MAG: GGDEF domain-containing protein [Chromatiaceae bacterium]|nr:GGDEF domain-containing protein [Chromatiaceae bacterium]